MKKENIKIYQPQIIVWDSAVSVSKKHNNFMGHKVNM